MAIQTRTVSYAKELDDVAKMPAELIRKIRELKGQGLSTAAIVTATATAEYQAFVDAVMGFSDIASEVDTNRMVALQTAGYRGGELIDALL